MLRNVSSMNRLIEIEADDDGPLFTKAHKKQETIWAKQYKKEDLPPDDILMKYPEKGEEKELWSAGIDIANNLLNRVGINRYHYDGYDYDGDEGFYHWIDRPSKSGDHPSLYAKISSGRRMSSRTMTKEKLKQQLWKITKTRTKILIFSSMLTRINWRKRSIDYHNALTRLRKVSKKNRPRSVCQGMDPSTNLH